MSFAYSTSTSSTDNIDINDFIKNWLLILPNYDRFEYDLLEFLAVLYRKKMLTLEIQDVKKKLYTIVDIINDLDDKYSNFHLEHKIGLNFGMPFETFVYEHNQYVFDKLKNIIYNDNKIIKL